MQRNLLLAALFGLLLFGSQATYASPHTSCQDTPKSRAASQKRTKHEQKKKEKPSAQHRRKRPPLGKQKPRKRKKQPWEKGPCCFDGKRCTTLPSKVWKGRSWRKENIKPLQRCYENHLKGGYPYQGSIRIDIRIHAKGHVTNARVLQSAFGTKLRRCFLHVIRKWDFPTHTCPQRRWIIRFIFRPSP